MAFDAEWTYLVVLNKGIWLSGKVNCIGIFLSPGVLAPSGFITVKTKLLQLKVG